MTASSRKFGQDRLRAPNLNDLFKRKKLMNEQTFKHEMTKAKTFHDLGENTDY